jgi:GNAT superfamily N-acetyltransferase
MDAGKVETSVRDARAEDAEAMSRLCTQLGYPAQGSAIPKRLARLQSDPNARALVADAGDGPIGLATVHLRHTINHEAPIAQLTLLVVDESQRTRGVGRALVEAAERWAHAQGCHRIVVTTALQRADAHAFYERIGYRHTGRRYGKDFD